MPDNQPTVRFSQRVANYIRYRPDYPPPLLNCLRDEFGLRPRDPCQRRHARKRAAIRESVASGAGLSYHSARLRAATASQSRAPVMKRILLSIIGCVGVLCLPNAAALGQSMADADLVVEAVAAGLDQPTQIAFLGPEDFLVTEKASGRIKRIKGGAVSTVLDLPVASEGYRGLLSLTLHPDFSQNGFVYVFYSQADADGGAWRENRVSRFTWQGASFSPASERRIAVFAADSSQNNGVICAGGVVRFGPDRKLYGSTGDMKRGDFDNGRLEQNTSDAVTAGVGGIYRLNDDGSIPSDNPFAAHPNPDVQRLIAYGVRDCFGLAFDSRGVLWMSENGPEVYDEINLVKPGFNSGWLKLMGPDKRNAAYPRNQFQTFDQRDLVKIPGSYYEDPRFSFLEPIGITAVLWLDSPLYPARLRGRLLVGDTNFGQLYSLTVNAPRNGFVLTASLADEVADTPAERNQLAIGSGFGITTDLKLGPDGFIYHVSLTDGAVRRIKPRRLVGDANGDGRLNSSDIMAMNLALATPGIHKLLHPQVDIRQVCDMNADGAFNTGDVAAFYDALLRFGARKAADMAGRQ